ncbi:MAG TPA: hypothetical protein VHF26_12370 [Trebonia sp.]|nr:hypothetical protein [Trebonia sp.]
MSLEIEFEYEDTREGVWSAPVEPAPLHRRWRPGAPRSSGRPGGGAAMLYLAIGLTALAVGAASTSGFLHGRRVTQDRATVEIHLGPLTPLDIQPLDSQPDADVAKLLATPWTDEFDQGMKLTVVNDGPQPVTLLSATLHAPQLGKATSMAVAAPGRATAPGGTAAFTGVGHFVCGDFASVNRAATTADLTLRTADGATRVERLIIDRFSEIEETTVCGLMQPPYVVRSTTFSTASQLPGHYKATVTVTNRAPFPLRMRLSDPAIQSWAVAGGLGLEGARDTIIPPKSTGTYTINVSVRDCPTANQLGQQDYALDSLAFSDARDAANSPLVRNMDAALNLVDYPFVNHYCFPPQS